MFFQIFTSIKAQKIALRRRNRKKQGTSKGINTFGALTCILFEAASYRFPLHFVLRSDEWWISEACL